MVMTIVLHGMTSAILDPRAKDRFPRRQSWPNQTARRGSRPTRAIGPISIQRSHRRKRPGVRGPVGSLPLAASCPSGMATAVAGPGDLWWI